MKSILVFLVLAASLSLPAFAQVQLSGEASAYSLKSSRSQNPRVVNKGNATFG